MAEEAFSKEVGNEYTEVKFYTKEKIDEFLAALEHDVHDKTIVIVKNIEAIKVFIKL